MDMGISGKKALICASSQGLGRGCTEALAAEGLDLVINRRNTDVLEATAADIRAVYDVEVITVACDVTTAKGQSLIFDRVDQIDILINIAACPPPRMWLDWDRDDFIAALDANMLTPIALMKAFFAEHDVSWLGKGHKYNWSICKSSNCGFGSF